ncbi:MAG: TonB-dependent receptor [Pyrinomonadaceae bacterium]|nr:TonB-dependent receptor [Pyrinomonadaceae bacterium]
MKTTKFIIAIAFVLWCALPTAAQQSIGISIAGRITDPEGAGLAGAIVTLYSRTRPAERVATTTDDTGTYRFERLADGEYIIEAEAAGFNRSAARVLRVERARASTIDIPLEIAGVREQVVVTASDTPQTIDETSKAITVVSRREIEERDEFYIAEALRTVPGLRVRQLGNPGALTSIRTRGLRNQDTAVLIDGQRLRDAAAPQGDASGLIGSLAVTDVSRIEVLRGSGSSLYGTNAIGGVINIITDEGGGRTRGSVLAEGGSLGTFRGQAQLAGGLGTADRIIYSAGVSHFNITRGVDGDDRSRNTSGQGRILFRLTPTTTFSARLYAANSFLQLNESPDIIGNLPANGIVSAVPLAPEELRRFERGTPRASLNIGAATFIPSANDPDDSQATRFFSGIFTFAGRPTEDFGYSLSFQTLDSKRTTREGSNGVGSFEPRGGSRRSEANGLVQTFNARTDFRLGQSNFITALYEFEIENYLSNSFPVNPANNSSVDVTQRSSAVFIQDQLRFFEDRLQLSAGFRAQFFNLRQPRLSADSPFTGLTFSAPPNAYTGDGSVAYFLPSTNTKLRAHIGNGYRAPSLFERFGPSFNSFTGRFGTFGDPRLRPERSIAFDAGVDQSAFNNRLRASATYFYTRLQETIGFGSVPQPDPFGRIFGGYNNTRGGLARGFELSATAAPSRTLDLFAAYTYTNADERTPNDGVIRSLATPDHQFSFVATQRFGRRVLLNFDLLATSDYLAPLFRSVSPFEQRIYRFDGIVKADLGGSYTLPVDERRAIRFFGKVDNLFNRRYFEDGFRTAGRTARAGAMFSF